jgi:ATP-binding cassette, subfamily B, bacterial
MAASIDGRRGSPWRIDLCVSKTALVVIIFDPPDKPPRVRLRQLPGLCRQALAICWRAAPRDLIIVLALQVIGAAGLAGLLLVGQAALRTLLDAVNQSAPLSSVLPWAIAIAGIAAVQALASSIQSEREQLLSEEVSRHVDDQALDISAGVELAMFDDPQFHDRIQRSQMGAKMAYNLVRGVFGLVQSVFGIVVGLAVIVTVAPVLILLLGLVAIPAGVAAARRGEDFHRFFWSWTQRDRQRMYLSSLLRARETAKEVRAFGLSGPLRRRYNRLYDERMRELRRLARRQIVTNVVSNTVIGIVLGSALLLVAWLALRGSVPLAAAGIAVAGTALVGQRMASFGGALGALTGSARHLDDHLAFGRLLPEVLAARPTGPAPTGFTELRAEQVTFRYPTAPEPALREVSLELKAGEVVALVGENGSGKTTLAKLLAGLYRPETGVVTWDGVNMSTVDPDRWRDNVAVIFQDFARYWLSAGDNIGLGRLEVSEDEAAIRAAARQAGADTFIEQLPKGYDTLLGPEFNGGTDLSIGQWQRIALARAFFRGAPVVILDEPTAALDPRAEKELFDRIRTLLAGRTVLLISHRFSSVRSADRIYVLDGGTVVESGDHDTLMDLGGLYTELFTLQAAAYTDQNTSGVSSLRSNEISSFRGA